MSNLTVTRRADLRAHCATQIHSAWSKPWSQGKAANTTLIDQVVGLGVGVVRDSLWVHSPLQQAWHQALADAGVGLYLNFAAARAAYIAADVEYLATRKYAHAVWWLAGENEPNSGGGDAWPIRTVARQHELYDAAAKFMPNAAVCGPALKHEHVKDYDADLSAVAAAGIGDFVAEGFLDYHFYPGAAGAVALAAERQRAETGYGGTVGIQSETGWLTTKTDPADKARWCVEAYLRGYTEGMALRSLYSATDDSTGTFGLVGKPAGDAVAALLATPDGGEDFPGWAAIHWPSDADVIVTSEGNHSFTLYVLRAADETFTLTMPQDAGWSCDVGEFFEGTKGLPHWTIPLEQTMVVAHVTRA